MEIKHIDDTAYYVVPSVPTVKAMVLNGAVLDKQEIKKSVRSWDMKPLVIKHTKDDEGNPLSASHVDKLREHVGFVINSRIDGDRMRNDFYLKKTKIDSHPDGQRLLQKIANGETIGVSTAYFSNSYSTNGVKDGKEYNRIQKDLEPNHIAILLDEPGACSCSDGCGINVNHNIGDTIVSEQKNELSLNEIADSLATQIANIQTKLDENAALTDGSAQTMKELAGSVKTLADEHKKMNDRIDQLEKNPKSEKKEDKDSSKDETENKSTSKMDQNAATENKEEDGTQQRSLNRVSVTYNQNSAKRVYSESRAGLRPSHEQFLKQMEKK